MKAVRRQGIGEQLDLFDEALKATMRHGNPGLGGPEARLREERQADTAWRRDRALTQGLTELRQSALNAQGNRRVRDPYARWCERGDREEPPYSILR
jgi:hypothetical protein